MFGERQLNQGDKLENNACGQHVHALLWRTKG